MDNHTTPPRRRLSDILAGGADSLRKQWESTTAAGEFAPLPAGVYAAHVHAGELFTAKSGTAGYKITFKVIEGEFAGRFTWLDCWLTPAALPMTKRDLGKLGVTSLDQLENGAVQPDRIRCKVHVALRADDSGEQFNRVKRFDVLGIDEPQADAFAPDDTAEGTEQSADAEGDVSFDPAQLEVEAAAELRP